MTTTDTLIGFLILVIIGFIAYSKYNNQTLKDTLLGIKETIDEMREESPAWETKAL